MLVSFLEKKNCSNDEVSVAAMMCVEESDDVLSLRCHCPQGRGGQTTSLLTCHVCGMVPVVRILGARSHLDLG